MRKKLAIAVLLALVANAVYFLWFMDDAPRVRPVGSAPTATLIGQVRTSFDHPNPTVQQIARRERTRAQVAQLRLPTLDQLPHVESVETAQLRSVDEIAERALCLLACAFKGEVGDSSVGMEVAKRFKVSTSLTPLEHRFLSDPRPLRQEFIDHAWGYECAHVMLWALGAVDALPPPAETCDAAVAGRIAAETKTAHVLATMFEPRPLDEILEALDLYYNLQWAATELRLRGERSDALDQGAVKERLRALNWLVGHLGLDWDDVRSDA